MVPVKPSDFKALIVKPEDSLAVAILKTYVKLPVLVYRLFKYMIDPATLGLSEEFCYDLRGIQCPTPVTEE